MDTQAGMLFAEPRVHRRPFPKRSAVPFDRWRNSGGKRGSTAVKGRHVMMLRRYGNVMMHERDSIRYSEYTILSDECIQDAPKATSSGTLPDKQGVRSHSAEDNREMASRRVRKPPEPVPQTLLSFVARGTKRPLESGTQQR
jgi:hypothetical protein